MHVEAPRVSARSYDVAMFFQPEPGMSAILQMKTPLKHVPKRAIVRVSSIGTGIRKGKQREIFKFSPNEMISEGNA